MCSWYCRDNIPISLATIWSLCPSLLSPSTIWTDYITSRHNCILQIHVYIGIKLLPVMWVYSSASDISTAASALTWALCVMANMTNTHLQIAYALTLVFVSLFTMVQTYLHEMHVSTSTCTCLLWNMHCTTITRSKQLVTCSTSWPCIFHITLQDEALS